MDTPYEYHDNKLGVKLKYLMSDRNKHSESLCIDNYRTLKRHMDNKNKCEQQLRAACFGQEALILFSSLDRSIKDALILKFGKPQAQIQKSWFSQNYTPDANAFNYYMAHTYGDHNKKLDTKYIELYTHNASVLNTVLLMKTKRKEYRKAIGCMDQLEGGFDIWQSLSNDVNAFREVEHNLPTQKDALRRKANQYQKEGYISLISGKLTTKNAIKIKEKEQMALIDELIAKHTNLDNTTIAKVYNTIAERLKWKTITAQTIANRKTESNLITFAGRNGTKALKNKLLMQNKRSNPTLPMLYWTLDGWDAELLYQKTSIDKKGYSTTTYHNRLTMIVVLDPFNKYPIGYAIGTHETPELIKEAMLNAMMHTKELFGDYYKPYQLQSDNYSKKTLTPMYQACTKHYTPASVGNAKSKVIEPYFNQINKKYCQMFDNWSGFNIASGSNNQPNDEMLNKIRKSFPDEAGCRAQILSIIKTERQQKQADFIAKWQEVSIENRLPFAKEAFLFALGSSTGDTNKLTGQGIKIQIQGQPVFYDSFDLNFRKLAHEDWSIVYNPSDLSEAMAVSSNGQHRFVLEQKHNQPMALAEQSEYDAAQRQRIKAFNKEVTNFITEERQNNHEVLQPLWDNPLLNDTLGKHLLVNSRGQHKDMRNEQRSIQDKAEKVIVKQNKAIELEQAKTWQQEQDEYNLSKINLSKYAEII